MFILRRIFGIDPQKDFSKARMAFDQGKYSLASKLFEKTYKKFDTIDMRIISLENAAIAAEYADMFEKSLELYYHTLLIKLSTGQRPKEVLNDIDKAIQMARHIEKPSISINKLFFMKFLIFLSEKEFDQLTALYNRLNKDSSDKYKEAFDKTWTLIHSSDTFEKKEVFPQFDLPKEFHSILDEAEKVMQRCSLCEVELKAMGQPEDIQKGTEFDLSVTITSHAHLSIGKISLKTGPRGRLLTSSIPELPLKMSTGENYSIIFSLIPNLPGDWSVGPLSLVYSIPSETGDYPVTSAPILFVVKDAVPALKLSMNSETIEEDLEYVLTISAENVGKTGLQDVKIVTEIPEGIKIQEGTSEKYISTLGEGESFQYDIRVSFDLDKTHFSGYIIKANGYIEDDKKLSKCSVRLGGN
ncbi:MAG: hypothetical protein JSW11_03230 [Candidatus Heimdallarchaeota archaeon]|nr:MAG: hypothetical protein JSW11_03230 [Candidatus Heimdallarchaeota archaeon]